MPYLPTFVWALLQMRGNVHQAADVTTECKHLLCAIIGGTCSLATGRSRGCRPGLTSRVVEPEVFEEVRGLLAVIDPDVRSDASTAAAARLAEIFRREAREDRHLLGLARIDEPEIAPALERLCSRAR